MTEPSRKNRPTLIVMAALLLGVPLLAGGFNKLIQPQRHAEAGRCLAIDKAAGTSNSCDFAIVASVCHQQAAQDRNSDPCQTYALGPREVLAETPTEPVQGRRYMMACKAPFVPKWGPSLSNASIQQKRCGRPEAPE